MLNKNIKVIRKSKGLSQEELAIKLNVVLMYDIATKQTGEAGRMRVQNIATGFHKLLTRAEYIS